MYVAARLSWSKLKTISVTTMAGPPALDEEELSSEDDSDEEGEGQGDNDYSDEGEVNVGLGGLVMREKDSEEGNQKVILRKNGGKRSSEEHLSGEAETEEEEDFSSPPAKVVTPSKTRVIVSQTSLPCCVQIRFGAFFHCYILNAHDPPFNCESPDAKSCLFLNR